MVACPTDRFFHPNGKPTRSAGGALSFLGGKLLDLSLERPLTAQPIQTKQKRPLEILDVSEAEEQGYLWLLTHSSSTAREVADGSRLTLGQAQRLLDTIEAKGLATHSPERPRRYFPASPDVALEALIVQRQDDLRRAQEEVVKIREQIGTAREDGDGDQVVELITNPQAERQVFEQMQNGANSEIAALVKLPMRVTRPGEEVEYEPQKTARARGVRYRSINDAEFLNSPGAIAGIRSNIELGEEVRVAPSLPFKMLVADRRVALIPLNLLKHA